MYADLFRCETTLTHNLCMMMREHVRSMGSNRRWERRETGVEARIEQRSAGLSRIQMGMVGTPR